MRNDLEVLRVKILKKHILALLIVSLIASYSLGIFERNKRKDSKNIYRATYTVAFFKELPLSKNRELCEDNIELNASLFRSSITLDKVAKKNLNKYTVNDLKKNITATPHGHVIAVTVQSTNEKECLPLLNDLIPSVIKVREELKLSGTLIVIDKVPPALVVVKKEVPHYPVYFVAGFLGTFMIGAFIVYLLSLARCQRKKDSSAQP